ncbi:hypothetical protein QFC19_007881 [Naganishia cerealis]|uniref:Uncharacterized protein n=1 Tax=Naganishia cerealis TaxID=610337 RepID=A0ACC2V5F1_9TREE|nr:hypothetical protein QFC19_007881 [Naganishia cerealis]
MFKFFRFLLIIFSIAAAILSVFALIGSYKNELYLTDIYLIDVHLSGLKLSKLFDVNNFKRELPPLVNEALILEERADVSSSEITTAINNIVDSLTYQELGLADVYSISFWGYCRGTATNDKIANPLKKVTNNFDNNKVNFTYCSKPTPGYKFDPLTVLKHEINDTINDTVDGNGVVSSAIGSTVKQQLTQLVDNLSYENLNLPGNLKKDLTLLNNLTRAAFALTIVGVVLSFLSVIIQLLGCFMSPDNCCLSFLNFIFEALTFIILLVGAALSTGAYLYVRKEVNNATSDYGVKTYLSIQYYAFAWSGAVAALLVVIFNLLGHCCGLFGTNRNRYRTVAPPVPEKEPSMAYSHLTM